MSERAWIGIRILAEGHHSESASFRALLRCADSNRSDGQCSDTLTILAKLVYKLIDGRAPPGVEPVAQFDSTRENLPGPDIVRIDRLRALS